MQHHEQALQRFLESIAHDEGVLAVLLNGSVARGDERVDSDVDVIVVVTPERWERGVVEQRILSVDRRDVDYPGGYIDVKLLALDALVAGADRGDDPFRASLADARAVLDRTEGIAPLVARASRLPDGDAERRVVAFLAQLRLHAGYFLAGAERDGDRLLLRSASVHAILAAGRALLLHAGRISRGTKYLRKQLAEIERPDGWDAVVDELLEHPTAAAGRRLVALTDAHCAVDLDDADAVSRFVLDVEYAWWNRTTIPEYS